MPAAAAGTTKVSNLMCELRVAFGHPFLLNPESLSAFCFMKKLSRMVSMHSIGFYKEFTDC